LLIPFFYLTILLGISVARSRQDFFATSAQNDGHLAPFTVTWYILLVQLHICAHFYIFMHKENSALNFIQKIFHVDFQKMNILKPFTSLLLGVPTVFVENFKKIFDLLHRQ
jgi:hypothetical protein